MKDAILVIKSSLTPKLFLYSFLTFIVIFLTSLIGGIISSLLFGFMQSNDLIQILILKIVLLIVGIIFALVLIALTSVTDSMAFGFTKNLLLKGRGRFKDSLKLLKKRIVHLVGAKIVYGIIFVIIPLAFLIFFDPSLDILLRGIGFEQIIQNQASFEMFFLIFGFFMGGFILIDYLLLLLIPIVVLLEPIAILSEKGIIQGIKDSFILGVKNFENNLGLIITTFLIAFPITFLLFVGVILFSILLFVLNPTIGLIIGIILILFSTLVISLFKLNVHYVLSSKIYFNIEKIKTEEIFFSKKIEEIRKKALKK